MYQWTFGQTLALFTAAGFALVGTQVTLFHYRGNFRNPTMWAPVIASPVAVLLLIFYALAPTPGVRLLSTWYFWIEGLAGLGGFAMHARGVSQRVGGWGMNNVLTGPPILLPLSLSAFSLLALMALYVRF